MINVVGDAHAQWIVYTLRCDSVTNGDGTCRYVCVMIRIGCCAMELGWGVILVVWVEVMLGVGGAVGVFEERLSGVDVEVVWIAVEVLDGALLDAGADATGFAWAVEGWLWEQSLVRVLAGTCKSSTFGRLAWGGGSGVGGDCV